MKKSQFDHYHLSDQGLTIHKMASDLKSHLVTS